MASGARTRARRAAGGKRGAALLHDPLYNKGTAFTEAEREALGLRGLLPPRPLTQDQQVGRVLENLRRQADPLDKFISLNGLHDRNESLFFRVVLDHPDEMMPIIYTPTVGLACQQYAHIFQRTRGIFVSAEDRGRIADVLRNWPQKKVGIIVVTDGERILGLGDLGANGMGIPIGKLSIYTACAGIRPELCLPVVLDVGTNNQSLLDDPLYPGLKRARLRGVEYDAFVEEFMTSAATVFPGVVIQFEDFANQNAFRILANYRERYCCFNDDIQGTAAVALAGLLSALRITRGKLADQRILFLGAGEAATGICELIVAALVNGGMPESEARKHCWFVDSKGLVVASRTDLTDHKRHYAQEHAPVASFPAAVEALKPTAIIGVAAVGQTFTREVLETMARVNERPIVFALSNPTSKSECTAEEAYRWTAGRGIFACGSPFDPVTFDGKTLVPRQGNNSYIFPGVGLGLIAARASRATDTMFMAAAQALTEQVTAEDLAQGSLYPALARIREVSAQIAAAVVKVAVAEGVAGVKRRAKLIPFVKAQMYDPHYQSYV